MEKNLPKMRNVESTDSVLFFLLFNVHLKGFPYYTPH